MAKASDRLKKGGGFLNGVDGAVQDYTFTDEFNGEPFVAGKKDDGKTDKFHSLYVRLNVRPDGAEEDVVTTLFAGGFDDFTISADGHSVKAKEEGRGISAKSAWGKLIGSMEGKGHPGADPRSDAEVEANQDTYDFSDIIGHRFRFVQAVNAEDTKKLGKRSGKDGKKYDRNDLLVETYYGPATGFKAQNKTANKPADKTAEPEDLRELAAQFVVKTIIKANDANGGVIKQSKLNTPSLTHFNGNPKRDDIRKFIFGDMKDLTEEAVSYEGTDYFITFDAATKEVKVSKA